MNRLEVNQVGGFPMTTRILDEIQQAHAIFNALGALAGNFSIISGCILTGSTVSDGVVYAAGEVFEFRGGIAQTKVLIKEDVENLIFQNGTSNPVIKTRYITFGTGVGAIDWSSFSRGLSLIEITAALGGKAAATALATLSEAVTIMSTKLDGIAAGAEVNVNADWDATTGDAQILNKPTITSPFLYKGVFSIGDVTTSDNIRTVNFADVGTTNYMVLGSLVSQGTNWDFDNDVIWTIKNKTATSFQILLREVASIGQNIDFNYVLIAL